MPVSRTEIDRISSRLCDGTPLPRPRWVPELSYGRHRGPSRPQSRMAAVAVTLYHCPKQGWVIPLTLRPLNLQHHGGQVCLPGGHVEAGETMFDAAFREFREELGVDAKVKTICGQLSPQFVYASDNLVHPVVALIENPGPWDPDPVEVAQVITLPLTQLKTMVFEPAAAPESADCSSSRQVPRFFDANFRGRYVVMQRGVVADKEEVDQLRFRAPALTHQKHRIWGATALILDQLAQVLHGKR